MCFSLVVILNVRRWCITVVFFCISYYLAMLNISLLPRAHLKDQVAHSHPASAAEVHRLRLPRARGVFLDQGWGLRALHWALSTALCLVFLFSFEMNIYIFWNIIVLQCCVRFCWTTSSISYSYMYTHPLLNLPATISVSPLWPTQSPTLSSLFYGAASHLLPVLHIVVNICQGYSLHWAPSHSPAVSTGLISIFVKIWY